MTHEDFVEWLDKKIQTWEKVYQDSPKWDKNNFAAGKSEAFEEVKDKFFTLTPPPTTLS